MNDEERMKLDNPNKHLLCVGDLCISKTYGIGYIDEIEPNDCWYPISVRFFQQLWLFGKLETKYRFFCYNTLGQTDSIKVDEYGNDVKFYKEIKVEGE